MFCPAAHTTPKKRAKNSVFYRFNFNGQERDDEVYGAGNSYTAEFWQYDSRLGRRWNVDPVDKPWMSPYHAFSNKPILNIDPNGANDGWYEDKDGQIVHDNNINSKHEFEISGIEGKWLGNKGVLIRNGIEVGEFKSNGEQYVFPVDLPSVTIYPDNMDDYWQNEYKNAKFEDLGKLGVWFRRNFGGNDNPYYITKEEQNRNIKVAQGTVSVLTGIVTLGSSIKSTATISGLISIVNGIDDVGTNNQGKSLSQQIFPKQSMSIKITKTVASVLTATISFKSLINPNSTAKVNDFIGVVNDISSTIAP